jgi:hypothetical protein
MRRRDSRGRGREAVGRRRNAAPAILAATRSYLLLLRVIILLLAARHRAGDVGEFLMDSASGGLTPDFASLHPGYLPLGSPRPTTLRCVTPNI